MGDVLALCSVQTVDTTRSSREEVLFTKVRYLISLSLKVEVHEPSTDQSLDHHVDVTWYFE